MGIDKINVNNQVYNNKAAAKITAKVPETKTVQPVKHEPAKKTEVKPKSSQPSAMERIEEQTKENLENTKKVKNAIAEVNRKMNQKTRCEFAYHEDTKRVSIKVIDSDTEEVIREIPPEETLDMLSKMWEVAGILVDEQR
ncbi:MAG: flagellar protein FlaG [Lachnospiraceae bacterium]|nr:flagellar protein FlaG [Lachnospiraceae bacterium]